MPIRVIGLVKRRPDLTHEQFIDYWSNKHGPLFKSFEIVKQKVILYSQFHVLTPQSNQLAALGVTVPDFDGTSEFIVENIEDFLAILSDPEYLEKGVPDEEHFLDRNATQVLIGDYQVKISKLTEST
ncbi:EthD domain-containing protein [Crucibulum laeve]|uniref:EthD domain-containing protein n=1 Tax=Crucibulum laeve TaxID=68775 RepID=A0A5C3M2H1_9AGAR|nr:EthD domain-containing protein [Crucibulum laeve]